MDVEVPSPRDVTRAAGMLCERANAWGNYARSRTVLRAAFIEGTSVRPGEPSKPATRPPPTLRARGRLQALPGRRGRAEQACQELLGSISGAMLHYHVVPSAVVGGAEPLIIAVPPFLPD